MDLTTSNALLCRNKVFSPTQTASRTPPRPSDSKRQRSSRLLQMHTTSSQILADGARTILNDRLAHRAVPPAAAQEEDSPEDSTITANPLQQTSSSHSSAKAAPDQISQTRMSAQMLQMKGTRRPDQMRITYLVTCLKNC